MPTETDNRQGPGVGDPVLRERYETVRARIARAASRIGRNGSDVMLVAVTKHADPSQIRDLIAMGHRDFGENRVQNLVQRAAMAEEFLARARTLKGVAGEGASSAAASEGVRWHMIGTLQRNKVKKAIELSRLIHTVDNLRLAEEIHAFAVKRKEPVEVLLQVNCSFEAQKGGIAIAAAMPLAEQIESMVNVRLRGLMTMAAYSDNPEDARPAFQRLRELFEEMRKRGYSDGRFNILSTGMSGDFEVAIEEGSNLVRVGSAIFGEAPANADEPDDEREEPGDAEGEEGLPFPEVVSDRERAAR
ncbi:MAG: YggS family pyridoxal phosphate-dependent enzyme [Phycisphaeraceae bacterium]|nr:YggS family pyridoxal phosphate-dependent enzyme [Phycisphaeraceae bacterium]